MAKSVLERYQGDRKKGTETEVSEHPSPQKVRALQSSVSLSEYLPCKAEMRNQLCTGSVPSARQQSLHCAEEQTRTPSPNPLFSRQALRAWPKGKVKSSANLTPHSTHKLEGLFGGSMNCLRRCFVLNPGSWLKSPNLLITQYFTF